MPASLKEALNPLKPWQHAKTSAAILNQRLHGGGNWGALYTSPWGTLKTVKYVYRYVIDPRDEKSPSEGMEVSQAETDARGYAIYGTVRVSGVNVIPPC
jgi:hypothetical protein